MRRPAVGARINEPIAEHVSVTCNIAPELFNFDFHNNSLWELMKFFKSPNCFSG